MKKNDASPEPHGGNVYRAARELGLTESDLIDFSSNINPLGPPEYLKNAIVRNLDSIQRYPDPGYERLRRAVAEYHALPAEQVIAGNGATELIYLFARALKPARALIAAPAFSEYERALRLALCRVNYFRLPEEEDFALDVDSLLRGMNKNFDLVVLCNPNNPTGGYIRPESVEAVCSAARRQGTWVLLDESFIEFVARRETGGPAYPQNKNKNVFILRSMTKFFALPGLRLGYSLCPNRAFNDRMIREKEPWSVNALAELAGCAVLSDREYREKTVSLVETESNYLRDSLAALHWLTVFPSEANFLLARIENEFTSSRLTDALLKKNILIRDASTFKFLNSKHFRMAVKDRADNRRLVEALGSLA